MERLPVSATGMPIFAWSSQARGFFSGRYRPELSEGDTDNAKNVIRTYYSDANWERYKRADELAEMKGCTLRQVALAWVIHQPLEVFALIGPATVAELDDCLGALDVDLSPEEVAWLNLESSGIRSATVQVSPWRTASAGGQAMCPMTGADGTSNHC